MPKSNPPALHPSELWQPKMSPRHKQMSPCLLGDHVRKSSSENHENHGLDACFTFPRYLLRTPDWEGCVCGGGQSKYPPVFMELQSGGNGSLQADGRHKDRCCGICWTCYSGNISALDGPCHFLTNDKFWPVALQRNGKNAQTHMGTEDLVT